MKRTDTGKKLPSKPPTAQQKLGKDWGWDGMCRVSLMSPLPSQGSTALCLSALNSVTVSALLAFLVASTIEAILPGVIQ